MAPEPLGRPAAVGWHALGVSAPQPSDDTAGPADRSATAGLRARVGRVRDGARRGWERVVEVRPDTPVLDAGFEVVERDSERAGGMLAGALAFRLFLVLVPLALVIVAGLGFVSASQTRDAGDTLDLSDAVLSTMEDAGRAAEQGRWITLLVGLGALVLAIRALIKALRITHRLAWNLGPAPLRRQVGATMAGLGVLVALFGVGVLAQWVRSRTPGAGIGASMVIGIMLGAIWLGIERLLPRAEGSGWKDLLPGAVLVGVLSQALHAVTVFYFAGRVTRASDTYGPLGVAAVALLWLYLLGRTAVAAAMLNATLYDRRTRGLRNYAPLDLDLIRGRRAGGPGTDEVTEDGS